MPPLEAALGRQRALTVAALVLLAVLAWAWLLMGAGMDRSGMNRSGMAMGELIVPRWSAAQFLVGVSMWWVMMVAMMLPAAAPVILLYAKVVRARFALLTPATGTFLAGYLAIWLLFSLLAGALQATLEQRGVLSPMTMGLGSKWLMAGVLVAAGLYQLSPLKEACLTHCRNPASFLVRHYRPGRGGAFRLGLRHGVYCLGCCWLLMALLFVGGVMNLAWVALLTLFVAAEKLLPGGRRVAFAAGLGFVAWGLATPFA